MYRSFHSWRFVLVIPYLLFNAIRRVVALNVDPNSALVSEVMTPNPTSVYAEDSAMEALGIMLERHFRHLPVRQTGLHGCSAACKCERDSGAR